MECIGCRTFRKKNNNDYRAPLPESFRSELATLYFMHFGAIQAMFPTRWCGYNTYWADRFRNTEL